MPKYYSKIIIVGAVDLVLDQLPTKPVLGVDVGLLLSLLLAGQDLLAAHVQTVARPCLGPEVLAATAVPLYLGGRQDDGLVAAVLVGQGQGLARQQHIPRIASAPGLLGFLVVGGRILGYLGETGLGSGMGLHDAGCVYLVYLLELAEPLEDLLLVGFHVGVAGVQGGLLVFGYGQGILRQALVFGLFGTPAHGGEIGRLVGIGVLVRLLPGDEMMICPQH